MRRGRTLILVLLILIIGLAVGFVVIRQLTATPPTPEAPAGVEVFIAAQNISQGGEVTDILLTTIIFRSARRLSNFILSLSISI